MCISIWSKEWDWEWQSLEYAAGAEPVSRCKFACSWQPHVCRRSKSVITCIGSNLGDMELPEPVRRHANLIYR